MPNNEGYEEIRFLNHQNCWKELIEVIRRKQFVLPTTVASWVFLLVLGMCTALLGFIIDAISRNLLNYRLSLLDSHGFFGSLFFWILWSVLLVLVSLVVTTVAPVVRGSGIPEIKCILTTTHLKGSLSWTVFLAKLGSLLTATGSGLMIGKEGPFVHLSACVATGMLKWKMFTRLKQAPMLRKHLLIAAVAAGVTAVFGAPIGGVLFSVEVTSTYFMVSNLFRAFVSSISCVVTFAVIHALKKDELFADTTFPDTFPDIGFDIIAFVILGVLCGIAGSMFVRALKKLIAFREAAANDERSKWFSISFMGTNGFMFLHVIAVALVIGLVSFIFPLLARSPQDIIDSMFSAGALKDTKFADFTDGWVFFGLIFYLIVGFVGVCLSITSPISCGLFTPVFALGAVAGRLYGTTLQTLIPIDGVYPGAFAVVGAAALSSSATMTVSTAIIVFELTQQLNLMVPVLVGVLVAYSVGGALGESVYDVLLSDKKLPYLPNVNLAQLSQLEAKDIMHREFSCLSLTSTYGDAKVMLSARDSTTSKLTAFPLVNNMEARVLLGCVPHDAIERVLKKNNELARRGSRNIVIPTRAVNNNNNTQTQQPQHDVDNSSEEQLPLLPLSPMSQSPVKQPTTKRTKRTKRRTRNQQSFVKEINESNDDSTLLMETPKNPFLDDEMNSLPPLPVLPISSSLQPQTQPQPLHSTVANTNKKKLIINKPLTLQSNLLSLDSMMDVGNNNKEDKENKENKVAIIPSDINNEEYNDNGTNPLEFWNQVIEYCSSNNSMRSLHKLHQLPVDQAPLMVLDHTPLTKLHFLFTVSQFAQTFVIRHGKLMGVVLRDDFADEIIASASTLHGMNQAHASSSAARVSTHSTSIPTQNNTRNNKRKDGKSNEDISSRVPSFASLSSFLSPTFQNLPNFDDVTSHV